MNAIIYFPHSLVQFLPEWMQGVFSFVPFCKIIIIIMRWLWDLAVDIPRGSPSLKSWFLWKEENQRTRRKLCVARTKSNNILNPHVEQTWATTLGVEHSHHCAIPAPPERNRILANCLRYNCYYICATYIDECTHGIHDCLNESANCLNTVGSYNCVCKDGYQGDGKTICTPEGK